jgi:hypothetical protein
MRSLPGSFAFATLILPCSGQTNLFKNPSFEENGRGNVAARNSPDNWWGMLSGDSPDQQPGVFGVTRRAFNGDYYAGIVSRPPSGPSSGWERMGQKLGAPLKKNTSYTVLMHLCYHPEFKVRWGDAVYDFHDPIPLSFYLYYRVLLNPGAYYPEYKTIGKFLGKTDKSIDQKDWRFYSFTFEVEEDGYDYFGFSAEPPGMVATGANILIDDVFLGETRDVEPLEKLWALNDSIRYFDVTLPNLLIRDKTSSNQYFKPTNSSLIESYELSVFNRWGLPVYEGDQTANWWDGSDSNQKPLLDGMYFYDFRYKFKGKKDDQIHKLNGWVNLITPK